MASSYTKGELVEMALGELGIAHYAFDIEAEEDVRALRRLDGMMDGFQAALDPIGYEQPATAGESSPSDLAGIDGALVEAVITNLALRIAPSYGKMPQAETKRAAREGKSLLFSRYAKPIELEMPTRTPRGAGSHRAWRRNYFLAS